MQTVGIRLLLGALGALLTTGRSQAQQLRFEQDSLSQVLQRAQQQQKPVFLVLTQPALSSAISKKKQAEYTRSGLDDAAVRQIMEREFLLVKADFNTPAGRRIAQRYHVSTYPTYLYFHPDGTVLHRSFGNTRDPQHYLRDVTAFQQKLASPDNLSALTRRYQLGERQPLLLRQYLTTKRSVGLPVTPAELDAYVQELPAKAFNSLAEVVFVHEFGPVVDSRAYKLARLNQPVVDSLYRTLPLTQRKAINSLISQNSLTEAIRQRNQTLAAQAANFARNSWTTGKHYQQGQQAYDSNMLRYYQATKDTARYLPLLVSFYDQHYLRTPLDTVRQRAARQQAQRLATPHPYPNLAQPDSAVQITRVITGTGPDAYALELNNGAWAVYASGTRTTQYLTQAMRWSQRTIAVDPRGAYYDTLAHLLYRLRLYVEAEATQQQAIAQTKKEGQPTASAEQELRKIRQRTL